jgi:hypothetical protein
MGTEPSPTEADDERCQERLVTRPGGERQRVEPEIASMTCHIVDEGTILARARLSTRGFASKW